MILGNLEFLVLLLVLTFPFLELSIPFIIYFQNDPYDAKGYCKSKMYSCFYKILKLWKQIELTSVSSARRYCSFIISVYVLDPTSGVFPPEVNVKISRHVVCVCIYTGYDKWS